MNVLPLRGDLAEYLKRHGLTKKFLKQCRLFELVPRHPSLHTELLEPRQNRLYSFRLNRKYRAIFIYTGGETIEIIDINPHYQ